MLARICSMLLVLMFAQLAHAVQADTENSDIRLGVEKIRNGVRLEFNGESISSELVLPALYERRNYAPVWTNPRSIDQLFDILGKIDADGLDSDDYHLPALQSMRASLSKDADPDPARAAGYDLLLTDSLIRLGYHLMAGKVDPEALDANWNMNTAIGDLDTILAMAGAIENATLPQLVDSLRLEHPTYARYKRALAHYREIGKQGGWPSVPDGPTLKPGMSDERVVAIRRRLVVTGELENDTSLELFDDQLEAAVKRFQKVNGLAADGVVGSGTLAAMNIPVQSRIDQIRVNLERARWVLHDLPGEYVLADIAGFRVRYVRNGKEIWSGRSQVGKPYRKTPIFRDSIRYLEVNPTWTVPPTILKDDILPKVKKDPDYLQRKDMQVLTFSGEPVDPSTIDWRLYPDSPFAYMIRQQPGPDNALGRIKFMFPNKHAIYLHDTPSRSLFNHNARAFSSGCIRVEHPFEFAEQLLDDNAWDKKRLLGVVESRETTRINLNRPVTVLLLYWTVDADDDGGVIFKQDVYDRDPAILRELNRPFQFRDGPILD